jgi:hypothetical protein
MGFWQSVGLLAAIVGVGFTATEACWGVEGSTPPNRIVGINVKGL